MSFFEKLKDATIGFSGYGRLARDPRGGFGYIAILLGIVLLINAIITITQVGRTTRELARQVRAWPDFRLEAGQFTFDGPMPFRQTMPDGTTIVIDTTGQTDPAALETIAGRPSLLVTRTVAYLVQPGLPPRPFDFSSLRSGLTRDQFADLLTARPERSLTVVYLFIYVAQLGFKAINGVILGLFAMLYSRVLRRPVPFEVGFRVALYAMSLPIIIQWVWVGFSTLTTWGFTLWWGTAATYVMMGLRTYLIEETAPRT